MVAGTKKGIETKDLLARAGISPGRLHDWLKRGLLPGWIGKIGIGGDGLRYRYPIEAVNLARKIKAWREQGIPYRRIRELLREEGAEV